MKRIFNRPPPIGNRNAFGMNEFIGNFYYYSTFRSNLFWVTVVVAICLTSLLYLLTRFGLRSFKFTKTDMKAAGLNRLDRRRLLAKQRRKQSQKKMRF